MFVVSSKLFTNSSKIWNHIAMYRDQVVLYDHDQIKIQRSRSNQQTESVKDLSGEEDKESMRIECEEDEDESIDKDAASKDKRCFLNLKLE